MEEMTILVFTCSAYSDLWNNNILLMNKNWDNHPRYLLCSDGPSLYDFKDDNLVINDGEMSTRIIEALNGVETEYVLFTLDDYFLTDKVNNDFVEIIIHEMKESGVDYCRLFKKPRSSGQKWSIEGFKVLELKEVYEVNFYPAIWKKDSLVKVLKKGEDIWKTEVRLTRRFRENGLIGVAANSNKHYPFLDVIRKGKYLKSAHSFIKKNGLFLSDRPVRTTKETLSLGIQTIVSDTAPKPIKKAIKKHMNKKGKIFYSDYENTDD